jgi:large exoprotein involved in heme utilization and adhesion
LGCSPGNIHINVRDGVNLSGFTTFNLNGFDVGFFNKIGTEVGTIGVGQGGNITIKARSLTMKDLSAITASTFGQGNAGNISVQVDDSVTLANLSQIRSAVEQDGVGAGGDITISGRSLTLTNGGEISATVQKQAFYSPAARGNGGNIFINTADFVNISGFNSIQFPYRDLNNLKEIIPTEGFAGGLFVSTETGTSGSAGTITVTTDEFRLADGAVVEASTANAFNAGSITINANTFEATGGGQVISSTESSGIAGNINLNISDSIALAGSDPTYHDRLARFGEDVISNQRAESGLFANTTTNSTGKGGNIFLNSRLLTVRDGAQVSVSATGTGEAGSLTVNSDSILLDRAGSLEATTRRGDQGNITLNANDIILRRDSNITTNATEEATGGDITINTDVLAALEDSDITANAVRGRGGNIQIDTQGIFLSPDSQITASSELGIDGIVTISTPEVDPTSGVLELPSSPVDAESLIAKDVCRFEDGKIARGSSFIITGKGGLPPTAEDPLINSHRMVEWETVSEEQGNSTVTLRQRPQTNEHGEKTYPVIQQAQGWKITPDGTLLLTAQATSATPNSPEGVSPHCLRK